MKKYISLIYILLMYNSITNCQSQTSTSLDGKSSKVTEVLSNAETIEISNPDSALVIYNELLNSLSSFGYPNDDSTQYILDKSEVLNHISKININYKSEFNIALEYSILAIRLDSHLLSITKETGLIKEIKIQIGVSNINIGKIYEQRGFFVDAIGYYMTATKIFEELNTERYIAICYLRVGGINDCIGDFEKALEYYKKSNDILKPMGHSLDLAESYYCIGMSYDEIGILDSALFYYQIGLEEYKKIGNKNGIARSFFDIGSTYVNYDSSFDTEKAFKYYNNALDIFIEIGNKFNMSETYAGLSVLYNLVEQNDTAKEYAFKGLKIAEELKSIYLKCYPYKALSEAYESLGDIEEAFKYFKLYKENLDSLYGMDESNKCVEASVKESIFNFDKKLQYEKSEFQKRIIYLLAGGIILIIIFSGIIYRILKKNTDNKNKIKVRDSLLNGEEKERQRIGQELHDGVCSDLSAVKMNLEILKNKSQENQMEYDKVINQLVDANESIRIISHNLNSVVLSKFGLITAINNLCEKYNNNGNIKLYTEIISEFHIHPDKVTEVTIYRIVQELFNNIIKHAQATEINFSLNQNRDIISIKIRDNGIGFDKNNYKNASGTGLNNIQNRVELLNGQINFEITENIGTTVIIEIPTNKKFKL